MITKNMFGLSIVAVFAIATIAAISGQIQFVAADEHETELKAILLDVDENEVGEAKYELEEDGSELKVELEGFTADSVFDITIGETTVGMIATDSEGNGETKWEPSPIDVVDGATITVDSLVGTFLTETEDEETEVEIEVEIKDENAQVKVKFGEVDTEFEYTPAADLTDEAAVIDEAVEQILAQGIEGLTEQQIRDNLELEIEETEVEDEEEE